MGNPTDPEWRKIVVEVYERDERPMFNVVLRWLWNQQEAIEVVQEAFMKLWEHRAEVDPATARAYAYRTAFNLAKNRKRHRALRRMVGLDEVSHGSEPEQALRLERTEEQKRIKQAIDALPEKLRQVILLRHFAEMDYAAMAETLDQSEGTIASRLHRALTRLKAELGDLADAFR